MNDIQMILNIKFKLSHKRLKSLKQFSPNISTEENFVNATLHEELGKPGEFLVYEVGNENMEHFIDV